MPVDPRTDSGYSAVGTASAKYFEGILFILVRRPYEIGDRVNVSQPDVDTPTSGSPGWIVKDIDLYTTTVVYGATNEVATYSNGSLAAFRIINAARSHKANVNFLIKFPISAPYSKLKIVKSAIEKFVQARPREWVSFFSFRATRVEPDLGFVEYMVFCQHREPWQNIGAVMQSKADLQNFCLELSKIMDLRYVSPPMPVEFKVDGGVFPVGALPAGAPPARSDPGHQKTSSDMPGGPPSNENSPGPSHHHEDSAYYERIAKMFTDG